MGRLSKINRDTKLYGIIGNPLGHTASPIIYNYLFKKYKQNSLYIVLEIPNIEENTIALFKLMRINGLSVTIPYKEWACTVATNKDATSSFIGASNTIVFDGNDIHAYNTDGYGAVRAIEENSPDYFESDDPSNILILGSGGSTRGISFALIQRGLKQKKIIIASRNKETGPFIVQKLNSLQANSAEWIDIKDISNLDKKSVSLIINTTPVGMKGFEDDLLVPEEFFTEDQIVFDIMYNPIKTKLIRAAEECDALCIPGYEMLLYQAIKQFEYFTGIQVKSKHIHKLKKKLARKIRKMGKDK